MGMISCLQYDLEGNFIKEYDGIILAASENGIGRSNVSACIRGRRSSAGGYLWKRSDQFKRIPLKIEHHKRKEYKNREISSGSLKAVYGGKEYPSIKSLKKDLCLHQKKVYKMIRSGEIRIYKRKIKDIRSGLIFDTLVDCARHFEKDDSTIQSWIINPKRSNLKLKWIYTERTY